MLRKLLGRSWTQAVLGFALSGLLSFPAIAGPDWKKNCQPDCKDNRDYLVTSRGIFCKTCNARIKTDPPPEMCLDHYALANLQARMERSQQSTDHKNSHQGTKDSSDEQADLFKPDTSRDGAVIQFFNGKTDRELMTAKLANLSLSDVTEMYEKWVEAGSGQHLLDQITHRVLSKWSESTDLTVSIPAHLQDLNMPLLLDNDQITRSAVSSMIFMDMLSKNDKFRNLAEKKDALQHIAKYFFPFAAMAGFKGGAYHQKINPGSFC